MSLGNKRIDKTVERMSGVSSKKANVMKFYKVQKYSENSEENTLNTGYFCEEYDWKGRIEQG